MTTSVIDRVEETSISCNNKECFGKKKEEERYPLKSEPTGLNRKRPPSALALFFMVLLVRMYLLKAGPHFLPLLVLWLRSIKFIRDAIMRGSSFPSCGAQKADHLPTNK